MKKLVSALLVFSFSSILFAEEPLSLQKALMISEKNSLALKDNRFVVQTQNNQRLLIEQSNSSSLKFKSRLQLISPSSLSTNQQTDDHVISLLYSKKLYDFGLTDSLLQENSFSNRSHRFTQNLASKKLRLQVMENFFKVHLSDLSFNVWNEGLSIAFIRMDRSRDKVELKILTEIDFLSLQKTYQTALLNRTEAEQKQRLARSLLAQSMSSNELPSDLEKLDTVDWKRKVPDYDLLVASTLENNDDIKLIANKIHVLQQKQQSNKYTFGPSLSLEADVKAYSKETSGTTPASVRLLFEYPIYSGNAESLKNEQYQIEIARLQNQKQIKINSLKHEVLGLWQGLNLLLLKKQKADGLTDYQDYYLDKSRALYEVELESDLGDAMTKFSSAILEQAKVKYQWILTWEALSMLTGDAKLSLLGY
jgi:outer membrane protein TolC